MQLKCLLVQHVQRRLAHHQDARVRLVVRPVDLGHVHRVLDWLLTANMSRIQNAASTHRVSQLEAQAVKCAPVWQLQRVRALPIKFINQTSANRVG